MEGLGSMISRFGFWEGERIFVTGTTRLVGRR
jgi:hypothetical protein